MEQPLVITSWSELYKLPNLVSAVDEKHVTLGSIFAKYEMFDKTKKPCSIRQCHKLHFNGRVIRFSDGALAYIGIDCGKKYFPDDWDRVNREFTEKEKIALRAQQLEKMKADAKSFLSEIDLRHPRVQWFESALNSLTKAVHPYIIEEVTTRASRNTADITMGQRLSEDDREMARMTGQAKGADIVIGTLRGLRIFRSGSNPQTIAGTMKATCLRILALQDSASPTLLRAISSQAVDLTSSLTKLDSCLAAAADFFSDANLMLLTKLKWARETRLTSIRIDPAGVVTASGFN